MAGGCADMLDPNDEKTYRWMAVIDGKPQDGHVAAATASDAAEAWASKQWPPKDCTVEVRAEGTDRVHIFTAEVDVSYIAFAENQGEDD